MWSLIQLASTLYQPSSVANIFRNRLNSVDHRFKKHIRVEAIAVIWSLWLCRNDEVFNDKTFSFVGYLPVNQYFPFMVISTAGGESGPVYRGLFTIEGYG
jgi:hypothetical protein